MCMMNNDGLSTLDNGFLAGKFSGAIRRHKKTVAAIKFDGIRMNRTGKPSRKRAAVERQIVQELNFDLRNWSVEMMLVVGDQKMLEAELAGAFDNDQDDSWIDDECPDCGRYSCRCCDMDRMEDHSGRFIYMDRADDGCVDCGCVSCQCDSDDSHYDSFYDSDDFYYTPRTYALTRHQVHMTEDEKMKLSDELWLDHEFFFGRNNLRTMTRSFGDEHYQLVGISDSDYGYDDFGAYDDMPVDELGGLPNHFDPSFDYRTHFWAGDIYDWDFSVDMEEIDFSLKLSPMKARRASRFSEVPGTVTYIDKTGFEVTDGKVKRVGRRGRSFSYHLLDRRCEDKGIVKAKDKTAEKRAYKRLLNEVAADGVAEKETRRREVIERETRRRESAEFNAYQRQVAKDEAAERQFGDYLSAEREAAERDARKRNATKSGAAKRDSVKNDNVDYTLPKRRMIVRLVEVERITTINGRRRTLSKGYEQMLCRS